MFGREDITRVILGNVPAWMSIGFYVLAAIASAAAAYGFVQRRRLRQSGRCSESRPWDWRAALNYVLFQEQIRRDPFAGVAHLLVTYGFLILFWGTCLVFLEHDTPLHFFYGGFYQAASLVIDLGGVAFLVGLGMFLWRRHGKSHSFVLKEWWVASLTWLLFAIGVSGFLLEATRIAENLPAFERWSVAGYSLAVVLRAGGISGPTALTWHRGLWFSHAALCVIFFALLPWQFFSHMTYGLASWLQRRRVPSSQLPVPVMAAAPGVSEVQDFSAWELLQTDACTTCGRCVSVCPAAAAGKPLKPRSVVLGIRAAMDDGFDFVSVKRSPPHPNPLPRGGGEGTEPQAVGRLSDYVRDESLWSCTTCAACNSVCPVGIDVYGKIVELRRGRVETGVVPEAAQQVFESVAEKSNPFGRPNADRMLWARGLDVPEAKPDEPVELLYWVGCSGSFDADGQSVSRAMVKILKHLGVNFRVLGCRERCTGDPARRLGEEGLFREQAERNRETLQSHGVKKILTHCPHCFNTFRNEYPQLGNAAWTVQHHSEFLAGAVSQGRLQSPLSSERMTYHDPCYLGRGNGVTEPPRDVLQKLQPQPIVEMPRNREESFCCGAGGGTMWVDIPGEERVEHLRSKEAAATGASTVVTGCPFCKVMLRTGLEATAATSVRVQDLAELVVQAEGL